MSNIIGIKKALPLHILELALTLHIQDKYDEEYIREQVKIVYEGKDIVPRCVNNIRKVICESPLSNVILERREEVLIALKYSGDKAIILSALLCSTFPIAYDVLATLGKYFQVQEFVNTDLLKRVISDKYGSNWSLLKGMYAVIPTFTESNLVSRPKIGIYKANEKTKLSTIVAWDIYCESYKVNNPLAYLNEETLYDPYFSFCERIQTMR